MAQSKTLKEWRRSHFMQQAEFAAFLGVSLATYRAWEQGGHAPRLPKQREIAEKLGVRPEQVVYEAAKKEVA